MSERVSTGPSLSGDPASLARKPKSKSDALGQVFTSASLAEEMGRGLGLHQVEAQVTVLDPCVGPYTFPAAIRKICNAAINVDAFDIDEEMCRISAGQAEQATGLVSIKCVDYLLEDFRDRYDYAIFNPPYVRQEWISKKREYQEALKSYIEGAIPGTANLYVYFIAKVIADLRAGGRMACIVYDSWQSTLFGRWLKDYLNSRCEEWTCEPAPAQPFKGRLIDATIIYAKKRRRMLTSLDAPIVRSLPSGYALAGELFSTRRGLRLKQASFFMTTLDRRHEEGSTPFIKKVNKISGYIVPDKHPEAALLLDSKAGDRKVEHALNERLKAALRTPEQNVPILTWYNERRDVWSHHRDAPKDPILFNYYLRRRPRHILNGNQRAYSDNFYGLTPHDDGSIHAWLALLNATTSVIELLRRSRNQGSGLAKIQLYEYRQCEIVDIREWSLRDRGVLNDLGKELTCTLQPEKTIFKIDQFIATQLGDTGLSPHHLAEALAEADKRAKSPEARMR
ncbi:MAG: N-6 DNA methylase [Agrobacterium tumefaciens]|nr:N-6 DNA methylase [Agrobacterium tumefaciens]